MIHLQKHCLYSDMDGTLIGSDKRISRENIEAVRRFIGAGGLFSVASGRNVDIARPYLGELPINAPAILYNGAAVYDFEAERFLHRECLDESLAAALLHLALKVYPGGCAQTFHEGPIRLYNPRGIMDHYILDERQPYEFRPLDGACEAPFKAMLYGEHEQLERVRAAVQDAFGAREGTDFRWTYSAPFYLEFLPARATKGHALRWIGEHLGIARADTAAMGDYYNDVEMLRAASLGAAVANAPEEVRRQADVVLCDNDHHAAADFIDHWLISQPG